MDERSQGFKHFISLILHLSISNKKEKCKDQIIIIDEPENHLHPSGIRYMRDELIKIGKNNYVFVATHSPFMIDNKNGTACGFALKINRALCFFTPGVPSEFKSMYLSEIKPWIIRDFVHELHTKVKRLFLFGISESLLGQKINALNLPSSIVVGYRAAYPLLELKLIENSTSQGEESEALTQILPIIKNYLLCENTFDLPERIANLSDNAGFCLFDNLSAGALAFELSSKVNLISAYLSSEDLNDEVRNTLLSQKARYFFVALKNPQHDCFDFELYDTCEKRKWHQQYRLEVTIKDKKKAAISLLAQDFIFKALQNLESIHPDNCEIKKISWGETYNAS